MDILDKIRKLLALSKSSNENEAAVAASKATALAAKYKIDLAIIDLEAGNAPRGFDVRINVLYKFQGQRVITWVCTLARKVGDAHGLKTYVQEGNSPAYMGVGDPADASVAAYTVAWLVGEVERLLETAKPYGMTRGEGKSWCNAFRVGCASRIGQRVQDETADARVKLTGPSAEDAHLLVDELLAARGKLDAAKAATKAAKDALKAAGQAQSEAEKQFNRVQKALSRIIGTPDEDEDEDDEE